MSAQPLGQDLVDDEHRLAALASYDILDTEPEQSFDDLVLLATQICVVPTALVILVAKNRQWFKARVGFNPCETPIDQSVCAHALGGTDLLVIPDLTTDPRTRANALVTGEPFIRFYAGAPLHTPDGETLGTLCVTDTEPRPEGLTEVQRVGLSALARQVMVQLELHRAIENRGHALAARAKAEEQLRLAAEATGIGVFDFDPKTGELRWDARVRAFFGVPARGVVTYEGSFLANVHPDDRADANAAVQAALDPTDPRMFDTEYRVVSADTGAERWLAARGRAIVENGETVRFVGTVRDVTSRKVNEAALRDSERLLGIERRLLRAVFQQAPVGISVTDAASAWTTMADQHAETMLGQPGGLTGSSHDDSYGALHSDGRPYALGDYPTSRTLRDGVTVRAEEMRYRNAATGEIRRFEVSSAPVPADDGTIQAAVTVLVDVEDRLRAEAIQSLMNHELGHRMKNLLAMVQAIAIQSMRGATDIETARTVLGDRLVALGKAQDLLLGGVVDTAGIAGVVRSGVGVHDDGRGDNIRYAGPDIEIGPGAALALSLMVHELATNAAKYGALSAPDGRVDLIWSVFDAPEGSDLRIEWRETGGPPVTPQSRKGFGSRLIERGMTGQVGGTVTVDYAPAGLTCVVQAPLAAFCNG